MDWARSQESGWGLRQCAGVDVFALHAKSQTSENRREKSLTMDFVATNHTYNSTNTTTPSCTPESLYIQVAGTVIFVLVWPFIAFDFKWFPLGRPGSALVGGTLMGLLLVLTQEGIYAELGKRSNLQTLYLLVGMMFLAYYYDREGLLQLVALRIFDRDRTGGPRPFRHALWKACLLSASLSAVVTNDATCVVVTPLLLKEHARQGRSRGELLPLLLGVATSANIGSASTYFGNPQNAFIAASSMDHISLVLFFEAALPAALVGMLLSGAPVRLLLPGPLPQPMPRPLPAGEGVAGKGRERGRGVAGRVPTPERTMVRIDWTVILLFSGLFVWLEGFQVTCLPSRAFAATRGAMDICSVQGSVANLIVAEKALKEAGFRLGFWGYVRFGAMSTVVVTLSGLPVVYFVSTVAKG
eukprot:Em0007g629a